MPIDKSKITKEMLDKALECETADELIALAKTYGFTLTKEEAEAYLAEMDNMELDQQALDQVAGGGYLCNNAICESKEGNGHSNCFAGDSEVAVPGGVKLIKDLKVGDKVITLDASGKEIIGDRQHLPFHSGWFRGICFVRTYAFCRRLSAYIGQ